MTDVQFWEGLFRTAAGTGIGSMVLVFAIWWLQKSNGVLISELKMERENRIHSLEKESDLCKQDRTELHKQNANLYNQIVDIYKTRGQIAADVASKKP